MQDRPYVYRHRHTHVHVSTRPRCPVCNLGVYSLAGIHPQCAAKRCEDQERAAIKAALAE